MKCRFKNNKTKLIEEQLAYYINFTHFWCRSPQEPGYQYELNLMDRSFDRGESSVRIYLEVRMASLKIIANNTILINVNDRITY